MSFRIRDTTINYPATQITQNQILSSVDPSHHSNQNIDHTTNSDAGVLMQNGAETRPVTILSSRVRQNEGAIPDNY